MICARAIPARAAFALVLAVLSPPARADDNHYQNFLVGERAASIGGAYTALSDDASGAYYNPAGLAQLKATSASTGR